MNTLPALLLAAPPGGEFRLYQSGVMRRRAN
jgi:hypothetical protein